MASFKWGIFGTGAISAKFVAGLANARDAEAGFIASRSQETAEAFARRAGIPKAIAGYEEAAQTGGVDAIYIATPPAFHAQHAIACLQNGIPVLIEKPFATSAEEARAIREAALSTGTFAMEGLWTRFLPAAQALKAAVEEGKVGEVSVISGNFGTSQEAAGNGMFDVEMGGGALAHLAPYPLSMGQWLFGTPTAVDASGTIGATGVDETVTFRLTYPGNVFGLFFVSLRSWASDEFLVSGTHGQLTFKGSIVRPFGLSLSQSDPLSAQTAEFGFKAKLKQNGLIHKIAQYSNRSSRKSYTTTRHHYDGNGYHYEADEVRRCVESGLVQSPTMSLDDSVGMSETVDRIRASMCRS